MARTPQTQAKRARELALKERRERKQAKKAETAEQRAAARIALAGDYDQPPRADAREDHATTFPRREAG